MCCLQYKAAFRAHVVYLEFLKAMESVKKAQVFSAPLEKKPFGRPGKKGAYSIYSTSGSYLSKVWLEDGASSRAFLNQCLGQVSGEFWRIDWTCRTSKYVRDADGQRLFKGIFTIMNEYGEIVLQLFTLSVDNFQEIEDSLMVLKKHLLDNNLTVRTVLPSSCLCLLCFAIRTILLGLACKVKHITLTLCCSCPAMSGWTTPTSLKGPSTGCSLFARSCKTYSIWKTDT